MEQRVINPADNFILDRMTDLRQLGKQKLRMTTCHIKSLYLQRKANYNF